MSHYEAKTVICPHCDHEFSTEDMCSADADDSLWDIAAREADAGVKCVSCFQSFVVQGGYIPHWTSAKTEEELEQL